MGGYSAWGVEHCPMPFLSSLAHLVLVLFDQVRDQQRSNFGQGPLELW